MTFTFREKDTAMGIPTYPKPTRESFSSPLTNFSYKSILSSYSSSYSSFYSGFIPVPQTPLQNLVNFFHVGVDYDIAVKFLFHFPAGGFSHGGFFRRGKF